MNQKPNILRLICCLTATVVHGLIYKAIMTEMLLDLFAPTVAQLYGESEVIGSHEAIRAVVGDDVILPCHLEPPFDVTTLTVEWRFNETTVVHMYKSRGDNRNAADKKFKTRTSLFHDELTRGNITLKLTNVSETDAGSYTCYVPKLQSQVKKGYINLTVDPEKGPEDQLVDDRTESPPGGVAWWPGVPVAVVAVVAVAVSVWRWRRQRPDKSGPVKQNSDPAERIPLDSMNNANNAENINSLENLDTVDNTHTVGNTELGN